MAKNIVVVGGGIIGCTTAYYITHHPLFRRSDDKSDPEATPVKVTLIEASAHGPAQGASGKAGGLIAKWAYPKELVDISYQEHIKLAEEHDGATRWGWRYLNCGRWVGRGELMTEAKFRRSTSSVQPSAKISLETTPGLAEGAKAKETKRPATGLPDDLNWVEENLTDLYSPMAGEGETAQVHPYFFTTSMMDLAKSRGAELIRGTVISIEKEGDGKHAIVTAVKYIDGETQVPVTIPATHVVLAAGAWSPSILPSLSIAATRAHSVTIRPQPSTTIAPYALFTEVSMLSTFGRKETFEPEIYARPENEVYACGQADQEPLPKSVDEVTVDQAACDRVISQVTSISRHLRDGTVEKRQACYLPSVPSGGGPIVGEAKNTASGLIIATGHTCWGICNAPGTAKVISELILDGEMRSAKLRGLQPSNFL